MEQNRGHPPARWCHHQATATENKEEDPLIAMRISAVAVRALKKVTSPYMIPDWCHLVENSFGEDSLSTSTKVPSGSEEEEEKPPLHTATGQEARVETTKCQTLPTQKSKASASFAFKSSKSPRKRTKIQHDHKNIDTDLPQEDRLQRSRERNRIHARKTRQRKKEQMQTLQAKADALKEQQLRLRQTLNEKHTASILLGLFGKDGEGIASVATEDDPKVEELLRRPPHEIPDSTKIPELPALILPGQHASKKAKATASSLLQENSENVDIEAADDGIDYELLGKDRSKCTPEELDQIRRERNRMHAKRTRDRKRLFMEEMSEVCRQLQEENNILFSHLRKVDPDFNTEDFTVPSLDLTGDTTPGLENTPTLVSSPAPSSPNISILNQITTLLEAAEATDSSGSSDEEEMQPIVKRRRL